jgi:hypothetical protein
MRNYRDDDRRDFGGDDRFQSTDRHRWNEDRGHMRRGEEGYGMPSWNRGREQNWSGYRDDDRRGSFGPRESWRQNDRDRDAGGSGWGRYERDRYEGRGMDRWEGGQSYDRHEGRGDRGWEGGGRDYEERGMRGGYEGNRSFGGGFDSNRGGYQEGRGGYERSGSSFGQSDRGQWGYGQMGMGMGRIGGMQGRMQGRGPKGYKRSDERIKEDVCECLSSGHIDASEIEVTVKNCEVTLTGTVDDRRAKRMAEELIDDVPGVTEVHNQIRVKREETRETQGTEQSKRQSMQAGNGNLQRS